jgi:GNAT superfamily N-acetyltransferase
MIVRPMRPGELETVISAWHETCADTYDFIALERGRTLDDRRAYFTENIAPRCAIWVEEMEGEILGLLALEGSYVDRLYVLPRAQRRGVGTALLSKARELNPRGLELFTHQRNSKGCAFYEKHGLKAVRFGLSPPPESEPDVEYHWRPG